ncbi:acetylglutamate kinase [Methylocystis sp. B8]|uniref:acetylglutamate kinase n=1 Tax=Methylocystis sp. B8 TaxID=544938 RepID=UPI001AEDFA8C|nr:acetylglutamate kinase [Methylocystis sp. B8]
MKPYITPMAAAAVAICGSTALAQQAPMTHPTTMAAGMHDTKADAATVVKMAMRKLWEDHITYTRGYIVSALADLPDANAVATRLLKNQDDIGDAIKPYYGENAGKKLSTLLRDHILIATEVVKAAKTGDKSGLSDAQKKWSDNGKDIAAFLSGANPNWAKKDLEEMLQKHLDLTTGEVVGRLNKDWTADIKAYDDGHDHMLKFADELTDGIAKQFPDKLKKEPVL